MILRKALEYWRGPKSFWSKPLIQVDEDAQHFYRKLGYKDCGGFVVDVPGYEQPMEMIMIKAV